MNNVLREVTCGARPHKLLSLLLLLLLLVMRAGAEAWVLSGNPEVSRHLGMRASSKKAVRLGGQKTMWLQYNIRSRD